MTESERNPLHAASDPRRNATVMASAGTGKTWLLVTRYVRLLLAGAPPAAILAITFTRKAADEMRARIEARLLEFLQLDDHKLAATLMDLGEPVSAALLQRARDLFEMTLRTVEPLRITTFHAFCQDILHRFPLDADIPPGFEVSEEGELIAQEAWDALVADVTDQPEGALAAALETLLDRSGGIANTLQAMTEFLQHRGDWWALTEGRPDGPRSAVEHLGTALDVSQGDDAMASFLDGRTPMELREFASLLSRHATKTNLDMAERIGRILADDRGDDQRVAVLMGVFFTQKGEPRARKASKQQLAALGNEGEARLLALHDLFVDRCSRLRDKLRRQAALELNGAWYTVGAALLERYQHIKAERRVLDFADLEWKTYQLLHRSDHAEWVQYKLDQRIDHILIDEFQDTNPTQWRMLVPLLEELSAGESERRRSVFLVGDVKQSIYRFRRADPALFAAAHQWLESRTQAERHSLAASRRSAPAVIELVNAVFGGDPMAARLSDFSPHTTHLRDTPGAVELIPLVDTIEDGRESADAGLRDPLSAPLRDDNDRRQHFREGRLIAARIQGLLEARTPVYDRDGDCRPIGYGDVLILLRSRTHLAAYEEALRHAGIPYLSSGAESLLDTLEIRDMVALLETLTSPQNNLALATTLRSPLFACSDTDLIHVAHHAPRGGGGSGAWDEALAAAAESLSPDAPLARAHRWLTHWRSLADQLPVHDLLDRIYCDANVLERYRLAFPAHLSARTESNLLRLIALALEVDSGRYPSLGLFLARLRRLQQFAPDALEAPADAQSGKAVRLMTIHGAKGLEATAVFLADAARVPRPNTAFRALCEWDADQARPAHLILLGRQADLDTWTRERIDNETREERREDANLLYVALTRARQYLFISGCAPGRGDDHGWYGVVAAHLVEPDTREAAIPPATEAPPSTLAVDARPSDAGLSPSAPLPDPRLARPLTEPVAAAVLTPSHATAVAEGSDDQDTQGSGALRGTVIHRMLDRLTAHRAAAPADRDVLFDEVARELGYHADDAEFAAWWIEACAVVDAPEWRELFDPHRYLSAYNEVPLSYVADGKPVQGVIDRLVVRDEGIDVIDYKTHTGTFDPAQLVERYTGQLRLYAEGAARLWPGRPVRSLLLFTHLPRCLIVEDGRLSP